MLVEQIRLDSTKLQKYTLSDLEMGQAIESILLNAQALEHAYQEKTNDST